MIYVRLFCDHLTLSTSSSRDITGCSEENAHIKAPVTVTVIDGRKSCYTELSYYKMASSQYGVNL